MHIIKQKVLAIGTGDFLKLLASEIFVDKSLFIQALLADGAEALLITRPRRWGKTLNMSMLYHFLRCDVRQDPTTGQLTTFNPLPGLFDDLKLGQQYPELVTQHQGQWPVIFMTLKGVVGNDLTTLEQGFKSILEKVYKSHSYLLPWLHTKTDKPAQRAAQYFNDVIDNQLKLDSLQQALYLLCELLYQYHGRKVFVLLDEYDSPLNNTFLQPELYQEVLTFLRGFLGNGLKDNPYLEKGVMTGILRVARADLFSGLNNFKEYSLLHERYAEHFGFTEQEVTDLFNLPTVKQLIAKHTPNPEQIKNWYNGYTIGRMTIYNPWSIMMCISEGGMLAPYWVATGSDVLLRDLLQEQDELLQQLEELLTEGALPVTISPHINMVDMTPEVQFWSLMLAAGYVTLAEEIPTESPIEFPCLVRIPNAEVKSAHEHLIIHWFRQQVGPKYTSLIHDLFYGEIEAFAAELNRYLQAATSVRQVGPRRAEQFYQGFMLGLLIVMRKEFTIQSEVESGQGYADTLMIPKHKRFPMAVVFEYKVGKSSAGLASKVAEALAQIDAKSYLARVEQYAHIQQIAKIGVAFYQKEALVKRELVEVRPGEDSHKG